MKKLSEGLALNLVGILIKNRFYADNGIDYATQQCLEGFGATRSAAGNRRLQAAAARRRVGHVHRSCTTARFPRSTRCCCRPSGATASSSSGGANSIPCTSGFVTQPDADGDGDGFWLDTSLTGNHNTGHAFAADAATWKKHLEDPKANPLPHGVIGPEFTDEERFAIIEYLKIHRDLPETPPDYQPPTCQLAGESL